MIRVQTANVVSDVLGYSSKGENRNSVNDALSAIVSHGCGALLYLEPRRNDSHGSGLSHPLMRPNYP